MLSEIIYTKYDVMYGSARACVWLYLSRIMRSSRRRCLRSAWCSRSAFHIIADDVRDALLLLHTPPLVCCRRRCRRRCCLPKHSVNTFFFRVATADGTFTVYSLRCCCLAYRTCAQINRKFHRRHESFARNVKRRCVGAKCCWFWFSPDADKVI